MVWISDAYIWTLGILIHIQILHQRLKLKLFCNSLIIFFKISSFNICSHFMNEQITTIKQISRTQRIKFYYFVKEIRSNALHFHNFCFLEPSLYRHAGSWLGNARRYVWKADWWYFRIREYAVLFDSLLIHI